MKPNNMAPLSDWDKEHYFKDERLRNCPSDCARRYVCHQGKPLPGNKTICYVPENKYLEWVEEKKVVPDPRILALIQRNHKDIEVKPDKKQIIMCNLKIRASNLDRENAYCDNPGLCADCKIYSKVIKAKKREYNV